jgi:hypothetical protein
MHAFYYFLFLAAVVFLIYTQQVGLAVFLAVVVVTELILLGTSKAAGKVKGGYKYVREGLESEYKEFEEAKTSDPSEIASDQIKFLGERTGEEFFVEKGKSREPVAGISKGTESFVKTTKKLFKK